VGRDRLLDELDFIVRPALQQSKRLVRLPGPIRIQTNPRRPTDRVAKDAQARLVPFRPRGTDLELERPKAIEVPLSPLACDRIRIRAREKNAALDRSPRNGSEFVGQEPDEGYTPPPRQ
jgi:hypothetical protein